MLAQSLMPFGSNIRKGMPKVLALRLSNYLKLYDRRGRITRDDKKGQIPAHLPDILQRLELDSRHWLYLARHFEYSFRQRGGAAHRVRNACESLGQFRAQGINPYFSPGSREQAQDSCS